MKAKEVALLGFVSAAQEYVKKHIDDGSNLGDLKNIDIKKLREELFSQLQFFSGSNEDIKNLIAVGEDAFNDYKKENLVQTKNNIVYLLGNTFEVDTDDDDDEDISVTIDDVKEGLLGLEKNKTKQVVVDNNIIDDTDYIDESNESDDFGISDEDELYKAISSAASKSDDELASLNKQVPEQLSDVFSDVVNNENAFKETNDNVNKDDKPLSKSLKEVGKQEEPVIEITNEEVDNPASVQAPISDYPEKRVAEPVNTQTKTSKLSDTLKNIGGANVESTEEYVQTIPSAIDPLANSNPINPDIPQYLQFIENPGVDAVLNSDEFHMIDSEYEDDDSNDEDISIEKEEEISIEEGQVLKPINEVNKEETKNLQMDDSALEALEALNEFADNKEKKISSESSKVIIDENKATYDNIASIFPYLSYDFIKDVYAHREDISKEYKDGEKIILLHRCKFKIIDNLHEFVEITMSHDYQVNVDEKQMIVDVMKSFENEEGAILSNIYTIANQAKVLNGEYEGYSVITLE